ncbi:ABC transporter substrate-binding protein [Microvirga antarctica]|uniref:ABC transporter substrate-binding protein n=1 Tax=Microvirga antarctica TaxID=2819233 RepID=UPI001B30EB90|nr:ABC transporter substrate-binding protein [Microvirga antarctica]
MNRSDQNRRQFLQAAVALGASTALSSVPARAQSGDAMTYMTPFGFLMDYAETLYGAVGGQFQKRGITLNIEGGRGSAMGIQQLTAGNVLVSRTGGTDLLKAYAKDPQLVAIANVYPKDLFWVISHADQPIRNIADLAGKTIGVVSVGGATENLLDMMLAKAGIPKADVKREAVGTAPAAFEFIKAGRISGYISTNLTVFLLQQAKQPIEAWSIDKVAPTPGDLYVTTKKAITERPETLAKFLLGVNDTLAALTASTNLTEIVDAMATRFDLAEAKRPDRGIPALEFAMANFRYVHGTRMKPVPETFESAIDLMTKAGIVNGVSDKNYLDMSIWNKAFG